LPALEKSPDELASLGQLLIGALKTMLAMGLGARLEGSHREVIDRRPVAAPSPYLGVFDEYGYYAVRGFAVVPAQARSLGFSMCFGGQDLQSFGKASREEAAAIVANTLTKVGMFVEDPQETMELFEKLGGQALAVQGSGLTQSDHALLAGFYRAAPNAVYERRARIDPLDLRAQHTGEAHVLRGTTIVRAKLFFAGSFRLAAYRLNRFIALGAADTSTPSAALTPAVADGVATFSDRAPGPAMPAALAEGDRIVTTPSAGAAVAESFAHRLIDDYLRGHPEQEAVREESVREEAVREETASTVDPPTAADTAHPPVPSDAAIRVTVEAVIAESVRQDTPAGVEIPPLEAAESDFSEGGFLMPPGEPPATAALPIPRKSSTTPATTATPDPSPVARPRPRATLPRVAVDRLEELAAPDAVFNLDVREIHPVELDKT